MRPEYTELNYCAFEHIVKSHCKGTVPVKNRDGQDIWKEITSQYLDENILLISGLDEVERKQFRHGDGKRSGGIGKDMLAKFRNGDKELSSWIITAYMTKEDIADIVTEEFEQNLLCFFHGSSEEHVLDDLMAVIKKDTRIPLNQKKNFVSLYTKRDVSRFLAETFIYSIVRDKLSSDKLKLNVVVEYTLSQLVFYNKTDFLNALVYSMAFYLKAGISESEPAWYSNDDFSALISVVTPRLAFLDATTFDKDHRYAFDYIRCFYMTSEMCKATSMEELDTIVQKYGFTKDDYVIVSGGPIGGDALMQSSEFRFMFQGLPTIIRMEKTGDETYDVHMEQIHDEEK